MKRTGSTLFQTCIIVGLLFLLSSPSLLWADDQEAFRNEIGSFRQKYLKEKKQPEELLEIIKTGGRAEKFAALQAFKFSEELKAQGSAIIPQLIKITVREKDSEVLYALVGTLVALDPGADTILPVLEKLADRNDLGKEYFWHDVADQLNRILEKETEALIKKIEKEGTNPPGLSKYLDKARFLLKVGDEFDHLKTAKYLSRIGPPAERLIPQLIPVMDDGYQETYRAGAWALVSISSGDEVVDALIRKILEEPRYQDSVFFDALGSLAPEKGEKVIPDLIQILHADNGFMIRDSAAKLLGEYGAKAKSALPALWHILENSPPGLEEKGLAKYYDNVCAYASGAIQKINPKFDKEKLDKIFLNVHIGGEYQ